MSIPEWSYDAAVAPPAEARSGAGFVEAPARRRRLVARALGVPEARVDSVEVRAGRERFGRVTTFVRVTLADGEGGESEQRLVAKLYGDAAGADAFRVCEALRAAGMAPPAFATVPAVPGYLPEDRLLLMEHVPGRSWLEWLVEDGRQAPGPIAGTEACRLAADWLLALHGLPERAPAAAARRLLRALAARPGDGAASGAGPAIAGRCHELADRLPALALRLAPWPQRLGPALDAGEAIRPLPSHGDFHPGNLLLATGPEERATAIDLDGVALREPAFDVGAAVAQLLAMSFLQEWPGGGVATGARAARAFWDHYREGASEGARDQLEERTTLHALATLLGVLHYSFAIGTRRRDLAERWLPGLEAWWEVRPQGLVAGIDRFAEEVSP